jgi:flagellar protein FlgJ
MTVAPLQPHISAADIPPERLAGNTTLSDQEKIAEASRQFEAILLHQILSETQKTVIPSKYSDNSTAAGIYRDMVTNQLADSISRSGTFGLAKTFENQLTHHAKPRAEAGPITGASPTTHASAQASRLPLPVKPAAHNHPTHHS